EGVCMVRGAATSKDCSMTRPILFNCGQANTNVNNWPTKILCLPMAVALTACHAAERKFPFEVAPGVLQVGRLSDPRITESSGVVASRKYTNMFWTHNDGGGPGKQLLFAIHRAGDTVATFSVQGANFTDWEDIANDDSGHLY